MTQNMFVLICTLSAIAVFLFGYWLCSVEKGMEIKHIREDHEREIKNYEDRINAIIHIKEVVKTSYVPEVIGEAITDYWNAENEFVDRREPGIGC